MVDQFHSLLVFINQKELSYFVVLQYFHVIKKSNFNLFLGIILIFAIKLF